MAWIKTVELTACKKKKLNTLWEEWRHSQRSKTRVARKRRQKFREKCDKFWDIGASDAIGQIKKNKQTNVLL